MEPQPTVFIIDDDEAVRDQLSFTVRSVGLEVQTYSTAEEYLAAFDDSIPGCLVLDVRLTGMSGLDLYRRLTEEEQSPPVILITGHGDIPMAIDAIRAGVVDFLEKPFREQQLLDAIRKAIEQDANTRRGRAEAAEYRRRLASLTTREAEVLKFLVKGMTNKAVASELGISHKTVETHRTRIMAKLHAETTVDLVHVMFGITSD